MKVGYTAIQSRTVGQEQQCKNRLELKKCDGPTDLPTITASCRVACPQLKTNADRQTDQTDTQTNAYFLCVMSIKEKSILKAVTLVSFIRTNNYLVEHS